MGGSVCSALAQPAGALGRPGLPSALPLPKVSGARRSLSTALHGAARGLGSAQAQSARVLPRAQARSRGAAAAMDDEEETYRLWKIRKTIMQVRLRG